ncbi:ribonuclease-like 3 [Pygocentrus nattereri]|uniref:ribonuclease-like 3 n=1 Tax=Pygocentrus nattereri TaxID=42514 RepID=UPI000814B334|nr:ribonuclease-like 3 [Pygocentrus nattereri]
MELHQLAVVLLLALCAHAQPADVMSRYKHFLNQHVFGNMNTGLCDSVIRTRKITAGITNNCKEINTFILATHEQVRAVCQEGGIPKGRNLYESTKPFAVVICRLRSGDRRPSCTYDGKRSTRTITVACDQQWPVHYEEDRLFVY